MSAWKATKNALLISICLSVVAQTVLAQESKSIRIGEIKYEGFYGGKKRQRIQFQNDRIWPIGAANPIRMEMAFVVHSIPNESYRLLVEYRKTISERRTLPNGDINIPLLKRTAHIYAYVKFKDEIVNPRNETTQFVYSFPIGKELFFTRPPQEWLYAIEFRITVTEVSTGKKLEKSKELLLIPDNTND